MDKNLKYYSILGFVLEYLQQYIKNPGRITINFLKNDSQYLFLEIRIAR